MACAWRQKREGTLHPRLSTILSLRCWLKGRARRRPRSRKTCSSRFRAFMRTSCSSLLEMHAIMQPPSTTSSADKQTLFEQMQARIEAWREGMPYPELKDELGEEGFLEFRC